MRMFLTVIMLCAVQLLSAQIRIIPQERLLEASEPKVAASPLRFLAEKVDFGTIDEMSGVWQGSARLVNDGVDTVVVTRIKSTCGCFKVELPQKVLAPKEAITVTLKYYPRGHAGQVMQRAFVYTNLSDEKPSAVLRLQGLVTASADRSDDYPYARGTLRLRQEVVKLKGNGREIERIACMNGGSTVLRPTVDANFLPKWLSVRFEPAELAPKAEGDMVVEYLPQGDADAIKSCKLYIKGMNVPPRQSVIEVIVEN